MNACMNLFSWLLQPRTADFLQELPGSRATELNMSFVMCLVFSDHAHSTAKRTYIPLPSGASLDSGSSFDASSNSKLTLRRSPIMYSSSMVKPEKAEKSSYIMSFFF